MFFETEPELSPAPFLNKRTVKDAEFPDAVSIKNFIYTGWLDECDAIINISKLKTHAMMGMSCAVKNMFGTIPGTTKPEYHMRFPEEMAFARAREAETRVLTEAYAAGKLPLRVTHNDTKVNNVLKPEVEMNLLKR